MTPRRIAMVIERRQPTLSTYPLFLMDGVRKLQKVVLKGWKEDGRRDYITNSLPGRLAHKKIRCACACVCVRVCARAGMTASRASWTLPPGFGKLLPTSPSKLLMSAARFWTPPIECVRPWCCVGACHVAPAILRVACGGAEVVHTARSVFVTPQLYFAAVWSHLQSGLHQHTPPSLLRLRWWLANATAIKNIKDALGGRLEMAMTGGAALDHNIQMFFTDLGVRAW